MVGHEPNLGELAARLIGARNPLEFKKGAICRIDCEMLAPKGLGTAAWFRRAGISGWAGCLPLAAAAAQGAARRAGARRGRGGGRGVGASARRAGRPRPPGAGGAATGWEPARVVGAAVDRGRRGQRA